MLINVEVDRKGIKNTLSREARVVGEDVLVPVPWRSRPGSGIAELELDETACRRSRCHRLVRAQ